MPDAQAWLGRLRDSGWSVWKRPPRLPPLPLHMAWQRIDDDEVVAVDEGYDCQDCGEHFADWHICGEHFPRPYKRGPG